MRSLRSASLGVALLAALLLLSTGCLGGGSGDRSSRKAALGSPQPGHARATNQITPIDSTGTPGSYTSIAVGTDGLPLVSYFDGVNDDLKVAHCSSPGCTASTNATLDNSGAVGTYSSIAIGADGLGLVSYYDVTNGDLKVAHCPDLSCSGARGATVDSAGSVGAYSSITIGTDGLGLISYHDATNGTLKVAHCSNATCTAATTTAGGPLGSYS
jgi:hypothetical protein